jgi:hypothetical protein
MASADAAWVDVLPSLAKFTPELKKALGSAMPAAGKEAGTQYAQGFTQAAVSGVERASTLLAAARKKEADAAGALRIAEAKLADLRESERTKTGQLVAAEEGVAKARRNLDLQTGSVARSTQQLTARRDRGRVRRRPAGQRAQQDREVFRSAVADRRRAGHQHQDRFRVHPRRRPAAPRTSRRSRSATSRPRSATRPASTTKPFSPARTCC